MDLSLQIVVSEKGETLDLELGDTTTIGRGGVNRIQISEPYMSTRHAVITRSPDGTYVIEDAGSKNGTFINDTPVTETTPIKAGDVLRFGLAACVVVERSDEILASPVVEAASAGSPVTNDSGPYELPEGWKLNCAPGFLNARPAPAKKTDQTGKTTSKKRPYLAQAAKERAGKLSVCQIYNPTGR